MLDSKRSKALPDLPTAEEQGTKDLIAYTWNAIFLPKNAPERDREEAQRRDAAGDARAGGEGQAVVARRRDRCRTIRRARRRLAKLVKDETEKWAVPIKASGVSVE